MHTMTQLFVHPLVSNCGLLFVVNLCDSPQLPLHYGRKNCGKMFQNNFLRFSVTKMVFVTMCLIFCVYVAVKDFAVFGLLQKLQPDEFLSNKTVQEKWKKQIGGGPWDVKHLMTDPICTFFLNPLVTAVLELIPLEQVPFLTADVVSISHIIVALVAFRFLSSKDFPKRQFGAFLFLFRQFLDELDGSIARKWIQLGSPPTGYGYYFDGIADSVAALILCASLYIVNQKTSHHTITTQAHTPNGRSMTGDEESHPMLGDNASEATFEECKCDALERCKCCENNQTLQMLKKINKTLPTLHEDAEKPLRYYGVSFLLHARSMSKSAMMIIKVLFTMLIASAIWNTAILQYAQYLDTDNYPDPLHRGIQDSFLKSWLCAIVFRAWQLCSATFIIMFGAFSIFCDQTYFFCCLYSNYGLKITVLLSFLTLVHLSEIRDVLEVHIKN